MVEYYPQELNISRIARLNPELEIWDEDERQRQQDVADRKRRGKGAPKKTKKGGTLIYVFMLCARPNFGLTAGESKRDKRKNKTAG